MQLPTSAQTPALATLVRFEESSAILGPLLWKVDFKGHLWLFFCEAHLFPILPSCSSSRYSVPSSCGK